MVKNVFKSQHGMSLVEVLLATGLIGLAALGVATLSQNMNQAAVQGEGQVARAEFTTALNSYLASKLGCEDLKVSTADGIFTEQPRPIKLTKWNYLGFPVIQPGQSNGQKLTGFRYFELNKMDAYRDSPAKSTKIFATVSGAKQELFKTTVNLDLVIKIGHKTYKYLYNVPVLLDAGGAIRLCAQEKTVAESCSAIRGIYNDQTQECKMEEGCQMKDTYITLTCSTGACDTRLGGSKVNQYTGGLSCPAGSNALLTQSSSWTRKIECGKKCTSNQNNQMSWYACMVCPN